MALKSISAAVMLLLTSVVSSPAQNTPLQGSLDKSYSYVVIGAFVFQKNAKEWTKYAKKNNMDAQFAMNPYRNLYYVYTYHSKSKPNAIEEVYKVRENHKINDAWVYSGELAGVRGMRMRDELVSADEGDRLLSNAPEYTYVPQNIDQGVVEADNPEQLEQASLEREEKNELILEDPQPQISEATLEPSNPVIETLEPAEIEVTDPERPYGVIKPTGENEPRIFADYKVYVNSVNAKELTEVVGLVEVMDNVRNRKLADATTHTLFGLNDPRNGVGDVKAVARIFGYRPKEVPFNVVDPLETDTSGLIYTIGDSIVVDMPLDRLKKGDIAVMWNVLFYKDAAIMRPESKAELNSLLEMLEENPDMKVRIHGHTNGNSRGTIVYTDDDDLNFFSLNGDHAKTRGSAKDLSEYRATAIQKWLAQNGIDLTRTEVKGWGGDRMLHGKNDPKAYENVRVEVEIVEDGS